MHQHTHQYQPRQSDQEIDGDQDEFGRHIDNPEDRFGDWAVLKPTDPELAKAEGAHELSRKIRLQRERKHDDADPAQKVSGGFNEKH